MVISSSTTLVGISIVIKEMYAVGTEMLEVFCYVNRKVFYAQKVQLVESVVQVPLPSIHFDASVLVIEVHDVQVDLNVFVD